MEDLQVYHMEVLQVAHYWLIRHHFAHCPHRYLHLHISCESLHASYQLTAHV